MEQILNIVSNKYLENFGYEEESVKSNLTTNPNTRNSNLLSITDRIKNELAFFQKFHGLKQTGIIDQETKKLLNTPRCGVPDFRNSKSNISNYQLGNSKFSKKELTYRVARETRNLGLSETRRAIASAFKYWSDVSSLKFSEVCATCSSDLMINFFAYEHGDGYAFDGPGSVLAHAFFPPTGWVHFDESETYTENTQHGINLRIVAAHEIGHALGLEHSFTKGSLMYPYYGGYDPKFKLHEDDIRGIQKLYGPPGTITTTRATSKISTTRAKTTTKKPAIEQCNKPFRSIFLGSDGNIYTVYFNNDMHRYDITNRRWSNEPIRNLFKDLELDFKCAILDDNNRNWFFKKNKVWSYQNFRLIYGYPKTIQDPLFPSNYHSVIKKNNRIYLIADLLLAFELDISNLEVKRPIFFLDQLLPGMNPYFKLNQAIELKKQYYLFDEEKKKVFQFDLDKNVAKSQQSFLTSDAWFPCKN